MNDIEYLPKLTFRQMSHQPYDSEYDGSDYQVHPKHRNWTPEASQWTITEAEEKVSFQCAVAWSCMDGCKGWGLHLVNGKCTFLGLDKDHQTQVFIAKFVCADSTHPWHGYPVHHSRSSDRPCRKTLEIWLEYGLLRPAAIRKVMKGQPCNP